MDGCDGMVMLPHWRSILVEMGMKVVVWYWRFEGVVVDERERDDGEDKDGDFKWRGFGLCRLRG